MDIHTLYVVCMSLSMVTQALFLKHEEWWVVTTDEQ